MECTIYTPKELKRKCRTGKKRIVILGRHQQKLVLVRRESLWSLPETECRRGESMEESARRALGEALGEAVFTVQRLCAFTEEEQDGGYAYVADITEWTEQTDARTFSDLPPAEETKGALLIDALRRWSWPFFPEKEKH